MISLDGKTFVTAREAAEVLGDDVSAARVWDWQRRRLVNGYMVSRRRYYDLDQLVDVEYLLRSGGRGRRRGVPA